MKTINKLGIGAALVGLTLTSCTKGFEDLNQNPKVSPSTSPEMMLTLPGKTIVDRDFDWFYDCYQYQMQWMQYGVPAPGSSLGRLFSPENTNNFYNAFYTSIGPNLVDIDSTVSKMPAASRANFAEVVAISKVMKVYAAWRVSDANGSIPYSKAFGARYGGTFTPAYDNQEQLFDIWETELKSALAAFNAKLPNQVKATNFDIYYNGKSANWAQAANVLRLKLAMRLMSRNPQKAAAIAQDVMANPAGLFASNNDEWKFVSSPNNFAKSGNWNMGNNPLVGSKGIIDYMVTSNDPRLPLFYEKNGYTKAAFDSLVAGGVLAPGSVYPNQQYVGAPASPDKRKDPANAGFFVVRNYSMTFNGKTVGRKIDTVSYIQHRLFNAEAEGRTAGVYTQPILTYAEQCFMIAELSVRGIITGQDAATWYNNGIKASVAAYNDMARLADIQDYTPVNSADVDKYIANANVALTGNQASDLEKIDIQIFLNHFKSPWEAWGSWKRTGYPKAGGILNLEPMVSNGTTMTLPRRWALPRPTVVEQQTNWQNAITDMQKTGQYGDMNDYTGRVWWDMK
ncbi:MAG: SusD/RagB family nutrient-binding outer membrane lipoprotein [Chitinophaga sp.]|uniref:SusD/RagB family nutrient-binding outer membrane lipoprotein n=1 Tax=Chitinophaga sp. TaxID=1869181 RepID=UPI0025C4920C|nr:SusD/RagB family nutrient-binding outer membrane lipoprotein [Chitinophaga sp.]MBV8252935.1 SusD/RagB family nutrient-binding outer membrane lipoprotein [Chitinophaga sp.]